MKDKFIRVLSPITLAVVAIFDIATAFYGVFAVKRVVEVFKYVIIASKTSAFFFAAIEVFAIILAVLVTKEILSHGVQFYDDELEFTALDSDNIFAYDDIVRVETQKDDKVSLVKNFIDRQSKVILTLKDERVVTIYIGLTTKGTLKKVADEIILRTDNVSEIQEEKE